MSANRLAWAEWQPERGGSGEALEVSDGLLREAPKTSRRSGRALFWCFQGCSVLKVAQLERVRGLVPDVPRAHVTWVRTDRVLARDDEARAGLRAISEARQGGDAGLNQ